MVNGFVITPDRCVSDQVYDGSKYLSAFIVAMVLNAFGAVSLYVLGVTYLDDASSHGTASLHIGRAYYNITSILPTLRLYRVRLHCDTLISCALEIFLLTYLLTYSSFKNELGTRPLICAPFRSRKRK